MRPILFSFTLPVIGEVAFPAYFTLLAIGFGVAAWLTWRESKHIKLDPELIIDTNIWMVVWGVIGARVLHLIADGHFGEYVDLCRNPKAVKAVDALVSHCVSDKQCGYDYLCDLARNACYPPRDCLAVFEVWRGGLAYYGGFLFATAFAMYFLRKHRMPAGRVSDLASPSIAFGLFFGRMGCFLNGCCYGKITDSPVGVVFPRGGAAWQAQLDAGIINSAQAARPVHPTQLYEAGACLAIAMILYYVVRPNKRRDFDVLAGLMLLYGLARSVIEVFRDDDRGVFLGFISTSQIISIPLMVGSVALVLWTRRHRAAREGAAPLAAAPDSSTASSTAASPASSTTSSSGPPPASSGE